MRRSFLFAAIIALVAAGWVVSGQFGDRERPAKANIGRTEIAAEAPRTKVRVRKVSPSLRTRQIIVNGRTEASRTVHIRAEVAGRVVALGAAEGARVSRGAVIARIATEDRKARLAEAEALLRQRQLEYKAAQELSKKGFRSGTKLAETRAYLDSARAQVEQMRIALNRTVIRAPFDAILATREVERGAYVKSGDFIASLVDLDPVLVVGNVSERDVGTVTLGMPGEARLVDGTVVRGSVRYVSSVADPTTRTFRVELEVANPDATIRDGLTSELRLPLPAVEAYRVSPAVLSLAEDGTVGVKIVDTEDRVVFKPVKIIADTAEGMWLTGLSAGTVLITVGHEFVNPGQIVEPVPETVEGAS